jgi:hypothetical protein
MTTGRLVLRQHRWPIGFVVIACLAIAAAAVFVWLALAGLSVPARCIEDRFLVPMPPECVGTEDFLLFNEDVGGKVMAAMAFLPLVAGVLVGAPLVASELETRTATIAWSLGGSRRRWLLVRLAIVGVGLAALLALPAIAANALVAERPDQYDMATATMVDYGLRGPLVVVRGLASFSIGVLAGLLFGRLLPAVLVAAATILVIGLVGMPLTYEGWPEPETFVPRADQWYWETGGGYESGFVDASGAHVSWEELTAQYPGGYDETDPSFDWVAFEAWQNANFQRVVLGIPGERLAFVEWREMAALGGLSVVLLGVSLLAIEWRRPT